MHKLLLFIVSILSISLFSPTEVKCQKKDILRASKSNKDENGFFKVTFSTPYRAKKINKVSNSLGFIVSGTRKATGSFASDLRSLGLKNLVGKATLISKEDYAIYNKKQDLNKKLDKKKYTYYKGAVKFTGVWEIISTFKGYEDLPRFIIIYEKFGQPFLKFGKYLDISTLKSADIQSAGVPSNETYRYKGLFPFSMKEYHYWAAAEDQIVFGTGGFLARRNENFYQKKEDLGRYKEIFNLENIVDLNGKSYIKTVGGCLVLNLYDELDVQAKWTGGTTNGFCSGKGKYTTSGKSKMINTHFEGTLKLGIPNGYGCFKGLLLEDCGEWVDGEFKGK